MTAKAHSGSESLSARFLPGPVLLQQRALWHVYRGRCLPVPEVSVGGLRSHPSGSSSSRARTEHPHTRGPAQASSALGFGFLVCKLSAGKRIFQVSSSLGVTGHLKSSKITFIQKTSRAVRPGSVLVERVGSVLTSFQGSQLEAAYVYEGRILVVATHGSMTRGHRGHLVAGLDVLSPAAHAARLPAGDWDRYSGHTQEMRAGYFGVSLRGTCTYLGGG